MKKIFLAVFAATLCSLPLLAENEISQYTEQKLNEFVIQRIVMKSWDHTDAIREIDEIKTETFASLEENAIDYEQEACLLDAIYFLETYEHLYSKEHRAALRKQTQVRMKKYHAMIEKRSDEKISKWTYIVCADITNYYMTRSVAACFKYGFKVKAWYTAAIAKDKYFTLANSCLANWHFYAPAPFGSDKRARELYANGLKGAKTAGEQYLANMYYSQYLYEKKKKEDAKKYLQVCYDLDLGTTELDFISKCNSDGISFLQYLRNRSGVDEEIPENEKQSDD